MCVRVAGSGEGQWRRFDDSRVTAVDPQDVCTASAYILFFAAAPDDAHKA